MSSSDKFSRISSKLQSIVPIYIKTQNLKQTESNQKRIMLEKRLNDLEDTLDIFEEKEAKNFENLKDKVNKD